MRERFVDINILPAKPSSSLEKTLFLFLYWGAMSCIPEVPIQMRQIFIRKNCPKKFLIAKFWSVVQKNVWGVGKSLLGDAWQCGEKNTTTYGGSTMLQSY